MKTLIRPLFALCVLVLPPLILVVDRSLTGLFVLTAAAAALLIFFFLYAGVGALMWLAAGLLAFARVRATTSHRQPLTLSHS